ncbi:MAG: thiamine pyrophosphate-binding protein [Bacteroidota bacterium]
MPTVARNFARTLKAIEVRFVFGVPSGNMTDYIEALRKEEGIDFVLTGHESAAAFMAAVCGRLTGIPGACFGTFGPGATNLATGVGCAWLDRYPLLAFTDEMPEKLLNRTVQMNIDHQTLFQPITKWTTRLIPGTVNETILKAAGIAVSEVPGPVHLGVPAGIGKTVFEEPENDIQYLRLEKQPPGSSFFESAEKACSLFVSARKPLLAVGLSAVRAGVKNEVRELAENYQLPVVLTPMAKGMFPENHPLYAGVLFHALSGHVAKTYGEADLVIGIGYDTVEFNYEEWMPDVPLIHFDSRPADVDSTKITNVLNLTGDLKTILNEFPGFPSGKKSWNPETVESPKKELFRMLEPPKNSFGPRAVIEGLREALPEDGILTLDVGAHLHLAGQQWKTPSPEKLLMTNGWSSMGFGIPAAIAAKLCHPELPVVCLTGDGGFRMMVGEMATAKQLNLAIIFVVVNDNSLSLIRIKQDRKNFDSNYGTDLPGESFQPENNYFGVPVIKVTNFGDYQNALKKAFSLKEPVIIEAFADGREYDGFVLQNNK